jgi:hypothetical protein
MTLERVAFATLAFSLISCAQRYPDPTGAAAAQNPVGGSSRGDPNLAASTRRLQELLGQSPDLAALRSLRIVGMDEGPVPDFELFAPGGGYYNSKALVGREPFVTVFFATWCDYCAVELKTMQRAFEQVGPMPVIPVSVDGPETWSQVPAYLASFGIRAHAVRASEYPVFAASYNPFDTLPLLVVVGRNGGLVDCLLGYDPAHAERLTASLRLAKTVGPLANSAAEPRASRASNKANLEL